MGTTIDIVRAQEHNLKDVSLKIPRDSLVVITGVSGSGKSSLAFDTVFQEGQRKYIESLSSYARQFIGQMKAPEVERITGLSPTISIDQKTVNRNPRSTVGTTTGIYDFFRLLFARLGTPHCPQCGDVIQAQTIDQIADHLYAKYSEHEVWVMAPIVQDRKGEYRKEQQMLREKGFTRARINGKVHRLEEIVPLKRYEKHTIEAIVDRIALQEKSLPRLRESMETALKLTGSTLSFLIYENRSAKPQYMLQSTKLACARCGISLPELEPRLFSFNSVQGACPSCEGIGLQKEFSVERVIPDPGLSVNEGAIACITDNGNVMFSQYGLPELEILADTYGFSLDTPWKKLSERAKKIVLYGSETSLQFKLVRRGSWKKSTRFENRRIRGVMEVMQRVWNRWHIPLMEKYMNIQTCPACKGARLSPAALAVTFRDKNIQDFNRFPIEGAREFFEHLSLSSVEEKVGREILKEIRERLKFLCDVGLNYLSLDRSSATLSGGEGQRIRLASQVGSGLQGVLYVLDEPSIGLHARDNGKLLDTLFRLRDQGNSLLVVEHDEETMWASDYLLDMGPGAGVAGGAITAQGKPRAFVRQTQSITGQYLKGRKKIAIPASRRPAGKNRLEIVGASAHNLKNIDVVIPLGLFVGVTGVSGSGKSTLVDKVLKRVVAQKLYGNREEPGPHKTIKGLQHLDRLVEIDQSPIGRTPRSNPATYTGVFNHIRDLFSRLPEAKIRGYKPGRFSFNVPGGRCEVCNGAGQVEIEMQLLANVLVPCDTCGGKRFNDATLEVHYKGRNIYDVLEMSISQALEFFRDQPKIRRGLHMLDHIGLGYINLGQPSTTLSGGEAQRVKLATELQKPGTGKTLYLLDEPTTGLHFEDIIKLLQSLQALVDQGNTVLVIEHNLDVIKSADYLIDLGPEGGEGGGRVLAVGTPEEVAQSASGGESYTGRALQPVLFPNGRARHLGKGQAKPKKREAFLSLRGAHKHNLKNVSVRIPHHKLTVITGVSGSGKSSLAFGTLFAEGQRRFIESMSTYARRFLGKMDKGQVDVIDGLAPAIAIDQKTANRSSKSIVATITEIYDYFRLLYARLGTLHCPECGTGLDKQSLVSLTQKVTREFAGKQVHVLAPLYLQDIPHDFFLDTADHLLRVKSQLEELGFRKFYIDGKPFAVDQLPDLKNAREVCVHVDLFKVTPGNKGRLVEALETALDRGHGVVQLGEFRNGAVESGGPQDNKARDKSPKNKKALYSALDYCPKGHFFLKDPVEPKHFSFNSHWGACKYCEGTGQAKQVDVKKLIADSGKPLLKGGLYGQVGKKMERKSGYYYHVLKSLLQHWGVTGTASYSKLSPTQRKKFLEGTSEAFTVTRRRRRSVQEYAGNWPGLFQLAEKWYDKYHTSAWVEERRTMLSLGVCHHCRGSRLSQPYSDVTVRDKTIGVITAMTVEEALDFFKQIRWTDREQRIGEQIIREIAGRLEFLFSVGLGYLGLNRVGHTLSGGEAQRIRLASQIGSGLEGVLYVLDEPTVGLHQQDTRQLVDTLYRLRDLGNTVVVVEHDPEMIRSADHVVDMGPRAGEHGGEVVAEGTPKQIAGNPKSLTGLYMSGKKRVHAPASGRTLLSKGVSAVTSSNGRTARIQEPAKNLMVRDFAKRLTAKEPAIQIKGARVNNLKNIDVQIPLGRLVTFCGVSGSGKSSLVMDVLKPCVEAHLSGESPPDNLCKQFSLPPEVDQLFVVDQSPLGSTPRSNPITYGKVFDKIRDLFAATPGAKVKGYSKSRFSMNTGKGRCTACEGMGSVKVEMHFLSDVWVECEACRGKQYNQDTLQVTYKGKNIAEVLKMTVEEATPFFSAHKAVHRYLSTLLAVGLGYLRLGQPATTFSGGEAQRIKLAAELARGTRNHHLYLLDEPTTGLHLDDIHRLLQVLRGLVEKGHSVLVIEHHVDVIGSSDYVVELGPEGGDAGGYLLYQGTSERLAKKKTPTGKCLRG